MLEDDEYRMDALSKQAFDYAWAYFSVHAAQRMQAVNFFLISAAFLVAGFATAMVNDHFLVASAIGILGSVFACLFYRIECRIRSLLHAAESALRQYEDSLAKSTGQDHIRILAGVDTPRPGAWPYSKVFRYLYFTAGCAFVLGAVHAAFLHVGLQNPLELSLTTLAGALTTVALVLVGYETLVLALSVRQVENRTAPDGPLFARVILVIGSILCLAGVAAAFF